jgi:hypothetical protein
VEYFAYRSICGGVHGLFVLPGFGAFASCGDAVMANEQTFAEQWAQWRNERQIIGRGFLRRRALGLIVIGLALVFMAGASLDVFDATVGCIAVAAGGVWHWCLGKAHRGRAEYSARGAIAGRSAKLYSEKPPDTRRDPYFP